MIEVFRDVDSTTVGWMQSVLESEGIKTFMKNVGVSGTEAMIPPLFPAVCVLNPEDEEKAIKLIEDSLSTRKEGGSKKVPNRPCPSCAEVNPVNFEICWNCQVELEKEAASE